MAEFLLNCPKNPSESIGRKAAARVSFTKIIGLLTPSLKKDEVRSGRSKKGSARGERVRVWGSYPNAYSPE
jgi:hypothetical protein